jgi:hypothetical protein
MFAATVYRLGFFYKELQKGQFEMHSIFNLANEIPWIMAPASLIAATTIISVIVRILYTESIIKIIILWAVISLTLAAIVMRSLF